MPVARLTAATASPFSIRPKISATLASLCRSLPIATPCVAGGSSLDNLPRTTSGLLRQKIGHDPGALRYVNVLDQASQRLEGLIDALRGLAR